MLAPLRWIKDYAKITSGMETLAEKMVMTGNGVEKAERLGEDIQNVVTGKIISIERHPDADKLVVCMLDVGGAEPLQIVTGAPNVFEGACVPVAKAVAMLPGGPIKKGKLRGVMSYGMLCSGEELKLKEEDYPGAGVDGILILPGDTAPGQDVKELLGLDGEVIEFEVGANRPDCLSVMGVAREAAAAEQSSFTEPVIEYTEADGNVHDYVSVEVHDSGLCPRYIAAAVTDVVIGRSPQWMATRLREAGIRPINNIVDITNYVMIETGQPMHAFDLNNIRGGAINVRRARAGESMKTLDNVPREFNENMLLICDGEGPIGVAGVMGGQDSEIKDSTKTVIFEAAKFAYGNIRQTSRALGLSTESSMRFSKGVDAAMTLFAMKRALTLIDQLGVGKVQKGLIDVLTEDLSPRVVTAGVGKVNAILGTDLSGEVMRDCLNRVFIGTELKDGGLVCSIPSFRGDISGANDIAEEVARIYGYNNIEATNPRLEMRRGRISEDEAKADAMKRYLCGIGFFECSTYSFAGPQDYSKLGLPTPPSVKIQNPLGDDSSLMRTMLTPHMLSAAALNLNRGNENLLLFEAARTYFPVQGEPLPIEKQTLCIAMSGSGAGFFELKSVVENAITQASGAELAYERANVPYLHPGVSANISADGNHIGIMGEIAPSAMKAFEIEKKVFIAEINLEAVFKMPRPAVRYVALPRFPAAKRDIAVIVDANTGAGGVLAAIKEAGGPKLESAALFDVYSGEQLGQNKKSLAYSLAFRANEATMTDEEVDKLMARILKALEDKFGAVLR